MNDSIIEKFNITLDDKPVTEETTGVFQNGVRLFIRPQENRVWAQTKMRWINAYPLFEFVLHGLDIDAKGNAQFISAPDEELFMRQLGHVDDPPGIFPNVEFPFWIIECLKTDKKERGRPLWFVEPDRHFPQRVDILMDGMDYYHEWCISRIEDKPETTVLYNPVRVGRRTFERTPETEYPVYQ